MASRQRSAAPVARGDKAEEELVVRGVGGP
jgi:hypothetical protein